MSDTIVTATKFQATPGRYFEESAREPVYITKHNRPARVLVDVAEFERLKARDTRQNIQVADLPPKWAAALEAADYGEADPKLEALMD